MNELENRFYRESPAEAAKRVQKSASDVLYQAGMGKATGLGLALRQYRIALNLSLADVQQISKVSSAALCELELGKTANPTLTTIRALTKLYNLPLNLWFDE